MMQREYEGKHVLILEGYARQCLPLMRSFKAHGCKISLLCNSKLDLGYVSRFPDERILGACDPDRYDESANYICKLIKTGNYDLVVPLVDFSASILAEYKEELSSYAKIAVNDREIFLKSQDKLSVMEVCMENGIPCPKTIVGISEYAKLNHEKIKYPVAVKPRRGCGAKGFHCFETRSELEEFFKTENISEYVIQEYIPQTNKNMSVNLFVDNAGNLKSAFTYMSTRWYPIKGGTGTFNKLVFEPEVEQVCYKLATIMGLRGAIGVDLIYDERDNVAKIIEINPRILACTKIGFDAGIDLAYQILQMAFDKNVDKMMPNKKEIFVRMSQIDVLWFLKSEERFSANPSFFKLKNVKDQTFSWDDPLPWFAFLLRGMVNLKSEEEKRRN